MAQTVSTAAIPNVTSPGIGEPAAAACANASPAPKKRYHAGPPAMMARCSDAAIALSAPPAMSHRFRPTPWPTLDRRLERHRRLREVPRAFGRHVETVLQAHAELAGDVDAGLVREAHAGRELGRLATDEVHRLVAV